MLLRLGLDEPKLQPDLKLAVSVRRACDPHGLLREVTVNTVVLCRAVDEHSAQ